MIELRTLVSKRRLAVTLVLFLLLVLGLVARFTLVHAQDGDSTGQERAVQVLTGQVTPDGGAFYLLADLKEGQVVTVYVSRTSGNLDPFVGLSSIRYTGQQLSDDFYGRVYEVTAKGLDPLAELPAIYDEFFEAWDDDSGPGYDATFSFPVPADGDYQLLLVDSPAARSFGGYRLVIGLDAPEVTSGSATTTGDRFAVLDTEATKQRVFVQEITGTLTLTDPLAVHVLDTIEEGDILYASVEALSGGLKPALILRDYGEKPLRSGNLNFIEPSASVTYLFEETGQNYTLEVGTSASEGDYRLVVGTNAPGVLSGEAESTETTVLKMPIEVRIGIYLQQITGVDQVAENYGAVATLNMDWQDPKLAFSPDTCNCSQKVFSGDGFAKFAESNKIDWPQFTLVNQQGNRWVQNRNVVIEPDGRARYFERFTTDFQAPLFDFTRFPFDVQHLYMELGSLYRTDRFVYLDDPEFSGIGETLGEEEWSVFDSHTESGIEKERSFYKLHFQVHRYLTFYIFRIIVPIILIIIVAWFTFFLNDYGKRVDVSGANLLVFVAFNFTVSNELPRLGYLTFMDAVLIGTFVISAFVVAFNVFLKRMELRGHRDRAEKIDKYSIWIYPLAYSVGALLSYLVFLA